MHEPLAITLLKILERNPKCIEKFTILAKIFSFNFKTFKHCYKFVQPVAGNNVHLEIKVIRVVQSN